jgi:hypothetical protein
VGGFVQHGDARGALTLLLTPARQQRGQQSRAVQKLMIAVARQTESHLSASRADGSLDSLVVTTPKGVGAIRDRVGAEYSGLSHGAPDRGQIAAG